MEGGGSVTTLSCQFFFGWVEESIHFRGLRLRGFLTQTRVFLLKGRVSTLPCGFLLRTDPTLSRRFWFKDGEGAGVWYRLESISRILLRRGVPT